MPVSHKPRIRSGEGLPEGTPRIIRRPHVEAMTGLSRTRIYRLIDEGLFPASVPLPDKHTVGWVMSEVEQWIAERIADRDQGEMPRRGKPGEPARPRPPRPSEEEATA